MALYLYSTSCDELSLLILWHGELNPSIMFRIQLCGVRGGGDAASKSLFWQARKGLSYVLTFESEKDRNAAIMIARKYALDCDVSMFLCFP